MYMLYNPPTLRGSKRPEGVSKGKKIPISVTYRPALGLPPPIPGLFWICSPPLRSEKLSHGAFRLPKVDKIEVQSPLATKSYFLDMVL